MQDVFTPSIRRVRDIIAGALEGQDPEPRVSVGGWGRQYPPFAALVFETPSNVSIDRPTTNALCGPACLSVSFDIECQMWATRATAEAAGELTCQWATLVMDAMARNRLSQGVWESADMAIDRAGSLLKDGAVQSAMDFHIRVRVSHRVANEKE